MSYPSFSHMFKCTYTLFCYIDQTPWSVPLNIFSTRCIGVKVLQHEILPSWILWPAVQLSNWSRNKGGFPNRLKETRGKRHNRMHRKIGIFSKDVATDFLFKQKIKLKNNTVLNYFSWNSANISCSSSFFMCLDILIFLTCICLLYRHYGLCCACICIYIYTCKDICMHM